ncbi:MAG TPA: DUF5818 domain-containing protein [Candidatus Sulfotelmatobacter sp.]
MKPFIVRISLALALTLATIVLSGSGQAQEPRAQDPATTSPPQQQEPAAKPDAPQSRTANPQEPTAQDPKAPPVDPAQSQKQNEPQMPAAGSAAQTQDPQAFTGRILKEDGKVVLKDPVTKTSYRIEDAAKVKEYMGKDVKVTGKLDLNTNTIRVSSVSTMPH